MPPVNEFGQLVEDDLGGSQPPPLPRWHMRYDASGRFQLPLSAAEAVGLFTPEGERDWAPGWDPEYATGSPSEAAGTVFMTAAHGSQTIWVILEIDRSGGSASYARVTPGHHGGLVRVQCVDAGPGHCSVEVFYEMSLLGDRDSANFDAYAPARFPEMMDQWSGAILDYLATVTD